MKFLLMKISRPVGNRSCRAESLPNDRLLGIAAGLLTLVALLFFSVSISAALQSDGKQQMLPTAYSLQPTASFFQPDGKKPALPADAKLRLGVSPGQPAPRNGVKLPSVRGISFSPDGKLIAVRGEPGTPKPRVVTIWNAGTGAFVRKLEVHNALITSMQFSPDGRFLATGQPVPGAGLQIWDVRNGRLVSRMDGGRGRVHFLPGGGQIAVVSSFGSDDVVRVHDVTSGKEVRRFVIALNYKFRFSADGSQILSLRTSGRETLRIIDVVSGKELKQQFRGCQSQPTTFAFGPFGRTVAAASSHRTSRGKQEHHVLVWETATRRVVHDLKLHTQRVLAAAFSPDARFLATAGKDRSTNKHSVKIWELATGKPVHTFVGHRGPVTTLAYSPDGRTLASGSFDRTVLLWNVAARSRSFLPVGKLDAKTFSKLWDDLGATTSATAYRAIGRLVAGNPQAMTLLKHRVHSILVPSQNPRILRLIAELDDDDSLVRHRAMRELIKLRQIAMPILIRTIKETRSAEVRHRLRRILGGSKKTERFSPTDELRMRRIIHAAERAGGKQAEEILQMILENFPELHFGTLPDLPAASDAKATLKRLRNPLRRPAGRR